MPRLTLVVPCFNEAKNIPLVLRRCAARFDAADVCLLLVDNGSSDDTPNVLATLLPEYPCARSIRIEKNLGYGHGIVQGLMAAEGDYLGWTHADLQTDPCDALEALSIIDSRADTPMFVKGRRCGRPIGDRVFTVGMSIFETMLLRRAMWDINAQPTIFGRNFFERWSSPPSDFSLDLYAYYRALEEGLTIERFNVRFGERAHGVSHWNVDLGSKYRFIKRTVEFSVKLRRQLDAEPVSRRP